MPTIPLSQLKKGLSAKIHTVIALCANGTSDPISTRLLDLGFCSGENIQVLALTLFKSGPVVVKLGNSRFALRHNEAARILVKEILAS